MLVDLEKYKSHTDPWLNHWIQANQFENKSLLTLLKGLYNTPKDSRNKFCSDFCIKALGISPLDGGYNGFLSFVPQ